MDDRLRLLEALAEGASDAMVITEAAPLDEPGPRITHVNPAFTRMTGYSPEEVVGRSPRFLQGPETDPAARSRIREALARGEPVQAELVNYRKSGEPYRVALSIVPVRDAEGRITHWASVQHEVAGERGGGVAGSAAGAGPEATIPTPESDAATKALEESDDTLNAIIRASPLALKVLDDEGRVEIWNPAAERIFGWSEEEVRGQPLPAIPPEKVEEHQWIREATLRGEVVTGLETYRTRKDGVPVEVELAAAPLRDATGRVRGTIIILEDISERKRAETALHETTERLEAVLRAVPIAVTSLDLEGRVQFWNPAAERIFGWTEAEARGRITPVVPEDRRDELERELEATRRGEPIVGFETERVAKDGRRIAVRLSTAPLRDRAGEVRGMTSLIEDISERKEAAVRQRTLSSVLEATPDFVGTLDVEGNFVYLNLAARRMLGLDPGEELAEINVAAIHPRRAARRILTEAIPAAIRDGSWSGESELQHRDGRRVPISVVIVAHGGTENSAEIEFFSTIARDITAPKQREQALGFLADASELLTATLEYEPALQQLAKLAVPQLADFCMIDVLEESQVHRVAVAHRDPELEESMSRLRRYAPAPGQSVGAWAAIETGESELVEEVTVAWMRAATRNDEHFQLVKELNPRSVMIVPLVAHGHTLGAMTLASTEPNRRYDADDLVLAEELARRAALAVDNARLYQQSQRATTIRDQVLRIVAHDLRNPLNTVALSAGLLLEVVPEDRELERRHLETIQRAVWRANTLIQDLLDVAKSQAGTLAIAHDPVDPAWLVEESIELHRPQAEAKGLRLIGNVAPGLPPIAGDANRLLQLFGNIIGNAIKFTDEGEISVSAEPAGDMVRFSVSDTGPGIPDDQLPHLFDPFWQAQRAERAGAGLGLAISQAIVQAHGGDLQVDTELGVGTTFSFTIPVATPTESGEEASHQDQPTAPPETPETREAAD
ncbi:MAG TPA: PAS domain S-box protein [Longimicrobiales bacterium]|nr:PAS domain S-box protein [Longimicrobiales bacterium]